MCSPCSASQWLPSLCSRDWWAVTNGIFQGGGEGRGTRRASAPHSSFWDCDTDTGLKRISEEARNAVNKCQRPSQNVPSQDLTFPASKYSEMSECLSEAALIMSPAFLTSLKTVLLLTGQNETSFVWNLRWPNARLLTALPTLSCNLHAKKKKKKKSPNQISSLISMLFQVLIHTILLSSFSYKMGHSDS